LAGSTTMFCVRSLYPDSRTEISCSPGKSKTFLSPLSSFTKPTYSPSIQTPAFLSTFVAGEKFTCPITLFCPAERGARVREAKRNKTTTATPPSNLYSRILPPAWAGKFEAYIEHVEQDFLRPH